MRGKNREFLRRFPKTAALLGAAPTAPDYPTDPEARELVLNLHTAELGRAVTEVAALFGITVISHFDDIGGAVLPESMGMDPKIDTAWAHAVERGSAALRMIGGK